MTTSSAQRQVEILEMGQTPAARLVFPVSWILFGSLMVGALSFCYLIEESQVPVLGLTAWFSIWVLWVPLSYGISRFVRHCPIDRMNWKARLPIYFLGGILIVAALLVLRVHFDRYLHIVDGSSFEGFRLRPFLVQSVVYDVFAFVSFTALGHASSYYQRYTDRQIRNARTEAQMAEIQLGFLKAQLQPHFLLNSLNLISGQLYEDVERADSMIADLGALLRATLENPDQHEVPLQHELQLLELYLDIARTRFGPHLEVEKHIDARSLDALVPSLILQPLVENAIRHGMKGERRVRRIVITVNRDAYNLLLQVADDGPGLSPGNGVGQGEGIGLANIRRRLEQLYGSEHRFTLGNRADGGVVATIEIPFRPAGFQLTFATREAPLDHSHPDRRRRAASA
jgi:signal transduction histidine kinase